MTRRCRKHTEPEPMSEETKVLLAENRKVKQAAETEERVAKMAAAGSDNAWRRNTLQRYVVRVLELHGRDRLEFMEAHTVGGIFR